MSYENLDSSNIDTSIVYMSLKELRKETGISKSGLHNHIVTDQLHALRYKHRTYFLPEEAERYIALVKCGLLGKK